MALKIGLDFDGLILDSGELKVIAAQKIYGVYNVAPHDLESSVIKVSNKPKLSMDQYRNIQSRVFNTPEFMGDAKLISGAREGINSLQAEGHDIQVITSRTGSGLQIAKI